MKIPYESNQRQVMPEGGSAQNIAITASGGQNTFLDTLTKISGDAFEQKYDLEQKKKAIDLISDLSTFDAETQTTLQNIQEPGEYVALRQRAKTDKLKTVGQTYDKNFLDKYYGNFADWENKYDATTRKTGLKLKNTQILVDIDTTARKLSKTDVLNQDDLDQRVAVLTAKLEYGKQEGAVNPVEAEKNKDEFEKILYSSLINNKYTEAQEEVGQIAYPHQNEYIENRVKTYSDIYDRAEQDIGIGKLGGKSVIYPEKTQVVEKFSDDLRKLAINQRISDVEDIQEFDVIRKSDVLKGMSADEELVMEGKINKAEIAFAKAMDDTIKKNDKAVIESLKNEVYEDIETINNDQILKKAEEAKKLIQTDEEKNNLETATATLITAAKKRQELLNKRNLNIPVNRDSVTKDDREALDNHFIEQLELGVINNTPKDVVAHSQDIGIIPNSIIDKTETSILNFNNNPNDEDAKEKLVFSLELFRELENLPDDTLLADINERTKNMLGEINRQLDINPSADIGTIISDIEKSSSRTKEENEAITAEYKAQNKEAKVYGGGTKDKKPEEHNAAYLNHFYKDEFKESVLETYNPFRGMFDELDVLVDHARKNIQEGGTVFTAEGEQQSIRSGSVLASEFPDIKTDGEGDHVLIPFIWDGEDLQDNLPEATKRAAESGVAYPTFETEAEATEKSKSLSDRLPEVKPLTSGQEIIIPAEINGQFNYLVEQEFFKQTGKRDIEQARESAYNKLRPQLKKLHLNKETQAIDTVSQPSSNTVIRDKKQEYNKEIATMTPEQKVVEEQSNKKEVQNAEDEYIGIINKINGNEDASLEEWNKIWSGLLNSYAKREVIQNHNHGFSANIAWESWDKFDKFNKNAASGGLGNYVRWWFDRAEERQDDKLFEDEINRYDEQLKTISISPATEKSERTRQSIINLRRNAVESYEQIYMDRYKDAREAGNPEDIDWGEVWKVAKADPGGMAAHLLNALIADPEYFLIPVGWIQGAALGVQGAKAIGATSRLVTAPAAVTGGAATSALAGFLTEVPISISRQLGTGKVTKKQTIEDAKLVAAISPIIGVAAFAVTRGIPRIIPAIRESVKATHKQKIVDHAAEIRKKYPRTDLSDEEVILAARIEQELLNNPKPQSVSDATSAALKALGATDDEVKAAKEIINNNKKINDDLAKAKDTLFSKDRYKPVKTGDEIEVEGVSTKEREAFLQKERVENIKLEDDGVFSNVEIKGDINLDLPTVKVGDWKAVKVNENGSITYKQRTHTDFDPDASSLKPFGQGQITHTKEVVEKGIYGEITITADDAAKHYVNETVLKNADDIKYEGEIKFYNNEVKLPPKQKGEIDPKALATLGAGSLLGVTFLSHLKDSDVATAAETTALTGLTLAALWKAPQIAKKLGQLSVESLKKPLFTGDSIFQHRRGEINVGLRHINALSIRIKETIPDIKIREKITHYLEGDTSIKLNKTELEIANSVRTFFDDTHKLAKEQGVIREFVEHYVPHMWKRLTKDGVEVKTTGASKSLTKTMHSKERTIASLKEGMKPVSEGGHGLVPKSLDIAEIIKAYGFAVTHATRNKQLLRTLLKTELPDGRKALIRIEKGKNVPKGYQSSFDESARMKNKELQGYAVLDELKTPLVNVFDNFDPIWIHRAALSLNFMAKRMLVSNSLFHANALVESGIFSGKYNVVNSIRKAKQITHGQVNDEVDDALRMGLGLGVIDDVGTDVFYQSWETISTMTDRISTKLGLVPKGFVGLSKAIDKFMWDQIAAGSKLSTYMTLTAKALDPKNTKTRNTPVDVLKRQIAQSVNDMYGGQDWAGIAEAFETKLAREIAFGVTGRQGRSLAQLILFAPDWTLSNIRVALKAIPGANKNTPISRIHQAYMLRAMIYHFGAWNAVNVALTGKYIWENDDPTSLDMGNGYKMVTSKQLGEVYHWFNDPGKTALNKLGVIPKEFFTQFMNAEYLTPYNWTPEMFPEDASPTVKLLHRLRHAGENFIPIFAQHTYQGDESGNIKSAKAGTGLVGHPMYEIK